MTIICCTNTWFPPAMAVIQLFEKLKQKGYLNYANVYYVDISVEDKFSKDNDIFTSPTIMIYWDNQPFTIRRADYRDDNKYVGSVTEEDVYFSHLIIS